MLVSEMGLAGMLCSITGESFALTSSVVLFASLQRFLLSAVAISSPLNAWRDFAMFGLPAVVFCHDSSASSLCCRKQADLAELDFIC